MDIDARSSESIVINVANTQYEIIKSIASKDFTWTLSELEPDQSFDICWQDSGISEEKFASMEIHQRINHFPGMSTLTRKNTLAQNLKSLKKIFSADYDFFPNTWVLPNDLFDLKKSRTSNILIVKPESSCQGRGITLVKNIEEVPEKCVVQQYIAKPFLIDNLKFDLRLYVLVTGCDPLRIFLHRDGLVRFATEEYKDPRNNLENLLMHLTNYAINKKNSGFKQAPEQGFLGHKRSLEWLMQYFKEKGYDVTKLWQEIEEIVAKTLISGTPYIAHIYKTYHPEDLANGMCFEVLGFDVLLDSDLKPWLLEVNHAPSFTVDSQVDDVVKRQVISDTFKLINLTPDHRESLFNSLQTRLKDRNSLKIKDYMKWKENQVNAWRMMRDEFESLQETRYIKISTDGESRYAKMIEVAKQALCKDIVRRVADEEVVDEDNGKKKKKISLPRLKKRCEVLSKCKYPQSNKAIEVDGKKKNKNLDYVFKAMPAPKVVEKKVFIKPRKCLNFSGSFVLPKSITYLGLPVPEENKKFMKWKLVMQFQDI